MPLWSLLIPPANIRKPGHFLMILVGKERGEWHKIGSVQMGKNHVFWVYVVRNELITHLKIPAKIKFDTCILIIYFFRQVFLFACLFFLFFLFFVCFFVFFCQRLPATLPHFLSNYNIYNDNFQRQFLTLQNMTHISICMWWKVYFTK